MATSLASATADSIATINNSTLSTLLAYYPDSIGKLANRADTIYCLYESSNITTIVAYQQSYLITFLKAAFENPATPLPTIDTLLRYAQSSGITLPVQYNIEALKIRIKNFFTKKTVNK